MTRENIPASKNYLSDITGKLPLPDLDKLIKSEGLLGLVPENVSKYFEELKTTEDKAVKEYLCHIDKFPNSCATNKAITAREKNRDVGYIQWDNGTVLKLAYNDGRLETVASQQKIKPIPLNGNRASIIRKGRGNNLGSTVLGQGLKNSPSGTFYTKTVTPRTDRESKKLFRDAVLGENNLGIGDRAILFNSDGSVVLGTNAIRDRAVALERSANIPSETINNGNIPRAVSPSQPYKAANHPNKRKSARTNDLAGGVAALGGLTALIGVIALLLPQHFITSAITFLTSITTFFTNVNNAVNTYLTVVDSLLGIFGIKNTGKAVKSFVQEIADNALGKKNVQEIKNAFAQGVNSIAVTTKLLEKTQALANNADDKVDELTLRLGAVNNALGTAGLIPPELMATSKGIEDLVDTRTKGDEELQENLTALTSEILTKGETNKELALEQAARDKQQAKIEKDIQDVSKLLDTAKTDYDKSQVSQL